MDAYLYSQIVCFRSIIRQSGINGWIFAKAGYNGIITQIFKMMQILPCCGNISALETNRKLVHIMTQIMTQNLVLFVRFLKQPKLVAKAGELGLQNSFILQPGIQPALVIEQEKDRNVYYGNDKQQQKKRRKLQGAFRNSCRPS